MPELVYPRIGELLTPCPNQCDESVDSKLRGWLSLAFSSKISLAQTTFRLGSEVHVVPSNTGLLTSWQSVFVQLY